MGEKRGRLLLADTIRSDAAGCISALRKLGICCQLLSGDSYSAAASVAEKTGIDQVRAPCNPGEKLAEIRTASSGKCVVAMVGDGINDAPALAAAQTGIAFGCGPELARQSGNVVIFSDRLGQIPWLILLSRHTRAIINGNFAWSFGYNAIALASAAAGLLHPLVAAVAMVISSITVLANSIRIIHFPDQPRGALWYNLQQKNTA